MRKVPGGSTLELGGRHTPKSTPEAAVVRQGALIGSSFLNRLRQLRQQILDGRSDANIRFDDLRSLLRRLGFTERVRGSHHIFRKEEIAERLNLQRDGSHAKPYQVRQVRRVILKYTLEEPE